MTTDREPSSPNPWLDERPSGWPRRRRFGQRLGRYVLGPLVGSGGAASVYMARLDGPRGFERVVGLKLVHEHLLAEHEFITMFLDEANLSVRLQHPNIVHTYELCQDGDSLYLVLEYLQGQPLSRLYQRASHARQPLPFGLVAFIGARAADALAYAHELRDVEGAPLGIVHRDVSPDNLFITYDGQVKLLDFGIAHAQKRLSQTGLGQLKGKFRYMAPEYSLGRSFDGSLDLFALAATLYEVAVAVPAFEGDEQQALRKIMEGDVTDPREFRADFPLALWKVLERALNPDPAQRLGPASALARALDSAAALSPAQGRALLASTMGRLFADELGAEASDIAELRRQSREGEAVSVQGHVLTRSAAAPSRGKLTRVLGAGLVAVTAALGLFAVRASRDKANESASAAATQAELAPPSDVAIEVSVSPPDVSALALSLDRVPLPAEAPLRRLARGKAAVTLRVGAPGYREVVVPVVPDRDRVVAVTLVAEPPGLPSAAPSASGALARPRKKAEPAPGQTAEPSQVIRRYPF